MGFERRALLAGEYRLGFTRLYEVFDLFFLRGDLKRFSRFPPDRTSGLSPFVFCALASYALNPNRIMAKPRQSKALVKKRGYEAKGVKKML